MGRGQKVQSSSCKSVLDVIVTILNNTVYLNNIVYLKAAKSVVQSSHHKGEMVSFFFSLYCVYMR